MKLKPLIATPCYGGVVTYPHKDAMMDLAVNLTEVGIHFRAYSLGNESVVDRARNECAAEFYEDESYSHLFFIDADIRFAPQDFYDMLTSGLDFVVAPYRKKCLEEKWTVTLLEEHLHTQTVTAMAHPGDPTKLLIACAEGGTGFMCLSRSAMNELREGTETYMGGSDGKPDRICWDIFRTPIDAGARIGEDQYVCRRWRAMGHTVWCSIGARLGHVGHGMIYEGDFARRFARRPFA